jgi:hypothetical protein
MQKPSHLLLNFQDDKLKLLCSKQDEVIKKFNDLLPNNLLF